MDMPEMLTVGVVQFAPEATLEENRDKLVGFIGEARAMGCRLVVFPEGALHSPPETALAEITSAVQRVQEAAASRGIYVIMGLLYRLTDAEPLHNRLLVVGPDGHIEHCYDKIWGDPRFPNVPGTFQVDGIPCCAVICADRWVRGVEELPVFAGARIIFECSNNYDNEWIPDLGWYWYVPRALRNGAYVVFANTPRERPGVLFDGREWPGHGHSAVVAPDGTLIAAAGEEADRLMVATIEVGRATREEAKRRHRHPLFKRFWDVGLEIMGGADVEAPPFEPLFSAEVSIAMAAAQMPCSRDVQRNLERMGRMVREAKGAGADVVVFPELAVTGALGQDIAQADRATLADALSRVKTMARAAEIYVVFGMPSPSEDGKRLNSAFAVGPEGTLLTCYDQLVIDRPGLFTPGLSTQSMWFSLKGVPAVVTIGRDSLWSEIAELAAVRGALLHFHLSYDQDTTEQGKLLRKQLWVNLASFRTLTATVNAATPASGPEASAPASGGSVIWQDFYRGSSGREGGYVPHSAVRLAEAGAGEEILYATQTMPRFNTQFDRMTQKTNPQMRAWYVAGARAIYYEEDVR